MHLPYLAFLLSLTFSCTITPNPTIPVSDSDFSHSEFDTFLHQHVDESGLIDYPVLLKERPNLDRYIARTAHVSPDSHPALFARESDRLVYWINAYNAATINQILAYYPIANVGDVKPPWYGFFFPQRSGFFLFTRSLYGGRALSLYYLENSIIRKRFKEPRIHFALNCASRGCPRLPRGAFSSEHLDEELDREARFFFSEARNLSIDREQRQIRLSEILKWFESDFTDWLGEQGQEGTILEYVRRYVSAEVDEEQNQAKDYEITYKPYDWGLNDRALQQTPDAAH